MRLVAVTMLRNGVRKSVIYKNIGVKRSTLKRWSKYYREHGSVWRDPLRQNQHYNSCWFYMTLMTAMVHLVREHPRALFREHFEMLKLMRNHPSGEFVALRASKSMIDRHLHKLGFTRKRSLGLFREYSAAVRRVHALVRDSIPERCIVSVDETHTDGGDVFRLYEWALARERDSVHGRDPRSVPRKSTMMAVSSDGRILGFQSMVVGRGALTSADWRLFLQLLIPKLGVYEPGRPWTQQLNNCVVLFDNAPIHNAGGDTFLGNNGVPFLRLPPYSPDLQPIEGVFNDLKPVIRNLVYVMPDLLDEPHLLQATAKSKLSRRQIIGMFDRVRKVIVSIIAEYISHCFHSVSMLCYGEERRILKCVSPRPLLSTPQTSTRRGHAGCAICLTQSVGNGRACNRVERCLALRHSGEEPESAACAAAGALRSRRTFFPRCRRTSIDVVKRISAEHEVMRAHWARVRC